MAPLPPLGYAPGDDQFSFEVDFRVIWNVSTHFDNCLLIFRLFIVQCSQ